MYLPPFAPDYSGVCSALFDLNGLIVIHDAAGCTGNYTGFDEPRWFGSQKAVFCSGLRETDAILGNEEKFIRRIQSAVQELHPDFIAFVGSPVPMVIGTDFDGLAREIEAATGLPAFGFATNGLEYYNTGAHMAGKALLERFAKDVKDAQNASNKKRRSVNILGATPLDISAENISALTRFLTENGWEVNACLYMGLTAGSLQQAGCAGVNLAISQTGARTGHEMRERFGTPCVTGLPCGEENAREVLTLLERAAQSGENATIAACAGATPEYLVIGDEVYAQSVKCALQSGFGINADAATLFGREPGLYSDTIDLPKEQDILDAVNGGRYSLVIADPLICELVDPRTASTIPIAQYGVSSKLRTQYNRALIAHEFNALIGKERPTCLKESVF